jgi:hypothetical protein
MPSVSPYSGVPPKRWRAKTEELVASHPLDMNEIVEVVLACWQSLFDSKIGTKGFHIGRDIFPRPQIMGFFLEQLITLEMATRHPKDWCAQRSAQDKDLVYLPDPAFSVEIKTSSHARQIFGNRSYAQEGKTSRKGKSGYYLAVNFQKFAKTVAHPEITLIRFGWLDHTDWVGQRAQTGQQARLKPGSEATRLLTLHAFK